MALSVEERRFLKSWEEQRKGGKAGFVRVYTFGLFVLFYLAFVAVGLFSGWPFLKSTWLIFMGIGALLGALVLSILLWNLQQKKFTAIVRREIANSKGSFQENANQ